MGMVMMTGSWDISLSDFAEKNKKEIKGAKKGMKYVPVCKEFSSPN